MLLWWVADLLASEIRLDRSFQQLLVGIEAGIAFSILDCFSVVTCLHASPSFARRSRIVRGVP